MVVRLRLARWGRKDLPFYRIVAADARAPRDGKHLEILGTFNPIAASDGVKELRVNSQRVRYWMSVGAQPSDRVAHLLGLANVLPMPPTRQYTKKNVPKKDREDK
ncbi:hypothetical protein PHYBOEH_008382 [Phytophthora boehmeriae]|uniref:Ribosomal protein S16 n=1 Tax=Phytophthora boehmeriae TaxID=109152 RepID=A0A8T1X2V3_9STRA|nr:hypothetical protein PHYBOEH_008382 [Phytophthora boehmeriae]